MKNIIVSSNEAGQRLDKLIVKYLNKAPKSFIYKMLRKKNITLNGKKADGSEKLSVNDEIKLFLSDETIDKFSELNITNVKDDIEIIYEDENIMAVNKKAGMLSQKAEKTDVSLVEHVISYLLNHNIITMDELKTFKPGICNRLDRNTSGIVVVGKTLIGLQTMAEIFKNRTIHKYYLCIVKGILTDKELIQGYLRKDERTNKVSIFDHEVEEADFIQTEYEPICNDGRYTLLSIQLITGKSHQIRAHLNSIGHPILGDFKYGDGATNKLFQDKFHLSHQLLHSYRLIFPELNVALNNLSKKELIAPVPDYFQRIQKELFGTNKN